MPFIDCKFSKELSAEKRECVKSGLGELICLLGKSETYLMVNIEDSKDLYLGGKKLADGAYLSVDVFGSVDPARSRRMTAKVCDFLKEKLSIASEHVYITYRGIENWGWNGDNF